VKLPWGLIYRFGLGLGLVKVNLNITCLNLEFKHVTIILIFNFKTLPLNKTTKTPNQSNKGNGGFARWHYSFLHITW
jgi:hypothetical protein